MKKFRFKTFSLLSFAMLAMVILAANSCKKDDEKKDDGGGGTGNTNSTLTITLSHAFGGQSIQHGVDYITAAQDTIRITDLVYYFTNIKLQKDDGSIVAPDTYFLVNMDDPTTTTVKLTSFPKANYTKLYFTLGVDSTRNHKSGQTDALDPAHGMYWTWTSEYIFYRLKGKIGAAQAGLSFDMAGDGNTMSYVLNGGIDLHQNRTVNLKMDVKELFQTPNTYDLKTEETDIHSTTSTGLPKLIQNSVDMMSITSIQ